MFDGLLLFRPLSPILSESDMTEPDTMTYIRAGSGSVVILGGLTFVISLYAYTFTNLYRKNLLSTTPRNEALNALIFALKASAAAFVLLFTK